jgi:hypothetical protein
MSWPLWLGTRFRCQSRAQGAPLRASGVDRSARPSKGGYHAKKAKKQPLCGACARSERPECFAKLKWSAWNHRAKTLDSVELI